MEKKELHEKLLDAYKRLVAEGRITNRKEFASLLGMNYNNVIAAMNGREIALTEPLIAKAVRLTSACSSEPKKEEPVQNDGVFIPEKTLQMFTAMSESIKNLSELLKMSSQTYGIADSKKDLADFLDAHK